MIAFFFTMPISRMIPISAITLKIRPGDQQRQQRPTPAEGSVERIVIGCTTLSYKMPSTI